MPSSPAALLAQPAEPADDAAPVALPPLRLEHRPALDGLRGLAVAAVIAFHLGYLQGGFLGVDMFFTLSGYLITRLLLLEHASSGTVSLRAFWSRRAWRLLPALYVVLAVLCLYGATWASAVELVPLRDAGIATLFFVANWWFISSDAGYWDQFAIPSPLEHVWSLAIEQQFYLVWPIVVAFMLRRRLNALLTLTLALIGASTVWLAVLSRSDLSRAYFDSGSRAGSILVGAGLAMVIHRQDPWLLRFVRSRWGIWLAGAAAALIGWSWVAINGEADVWFYSGGYLAHAVAVAIVIAVLTFRTTGAAVQVLESQVLRRLGVISYGLYLWHWPVIVIWNTERSGLDGVPLLVTRLALSLLLTEASYRLVELPLRARRSGHRRSIVGFTVAAALIAGLPLVWTTTSNADVAFSAPPPPPRATGLPNPSTTPTTSSPSLGTPIEIAAPAATSPARTTAMTTTPASTVLASAATASAAAATDPVDVPESTPVADVGPAQILVTNPADLPRLRSATVDEPLRVLLVGDSYMYDAQPGIEAALEAMSVTVTSGARLGFTITPDGGDDSLGHLASLVDEHRPDLVVAMWARFDARWLASHDASEYRQRLDAAIDILTADGSAVAFIGLAPSLTSGVDRVPVDRAINTLFADISTVHEHAFYIDPDPIVAPDGTPDRLLQTPEGELLVRKVDVSHYCSDGAARFGLALSELVNRLTEAPVPDPASWWSGPWRTSERYDAPVGSCR